MPFFYIKNAQEQNVYIMDKPWEHDTSAYPFHLAPAKYKAWWKNKDTDGCLLSLNSTGRPDEAYGTRIDKSNPPRVIYGLSADYDQSVITQEYIDRLKGYLPTGCEHPPQWASISQGDHLHLFWLFESPVNVVNQKHADKFVQIALNAVKAKLFGVNLNDYDAKASEKVTQYIDIGKSWHPLASDALVPKELTSAWSLEAAEQTIVSRLNSKDGSQELPFETVDELIRKHYPHANLPPLRQGMRCKRFWDPDADNPTAATPMPDGFLVFTPHDGGFISWAKLFGQAEVDRAVGGSKATILEDFFFLPRKSAAVYYQRIFDPDSGAERYKPVDKDILKIYLKAAGFSNKPRAGERISEVDKAMITIRETNMVECAAPYLYYRPGRIFDRELDQDGSVLNISTIKTVRPDMTPDLYDGGVYFENPQTYANFPFLYRLLVSLFCETKEEYEEWDKSGQTYKGSQNKQLNVFISWLAHFYRNAFHQTPSGGQAMYLVGPSGCGKTFMASHIIPALMGGRAASGEQYFLYGGTFTKEISSCPVIVLDDVIPASEYAARVSATQKIKSFVASATLKFEAKGQDAVTVPFRGRLICTSNNTERDMTVLPTIDATTADKFTILSVGKCNFKPEEKTFLHGASREGTMRQVLAELPAFARFLLEWQTPDSVADPRWGVIGYQDPSIVREATSSNTVGVALDALCNYLLSQVIPVDVKQGVSYDLTTREGRANVARHLFAELSSGRINPIRISTARLFARLQATYPAYARELRSSGSLHYALTQLASSDVLAPFIRLNSGTTCRTWRISHKVLFAVFGNQFESEDFCYEPPVD